jgi:hypothetical protein
MHMRAQKRFRFVAMGVSLLALAAMVSSAAARQAMPLPTVGASFAAPYDRVWDATLQSMGIVKLLVADKATGRIQTEPYSFSYFIGGPNGGSTQAIQVALQIEVRETPGSGVTVQVSPEYSSLLFGGFTPGPTNNPWADLFARIADRLRVR